MKEDKKTPIKPYSKSELAKMYGVTVFTFMKWLRINKIKLAGPSNRSILTPKEVELIFSGIGEPINEV